MSDEPLAARIELEGLVEGQITVFEPGDDVLELTKSLLERKLFDGRFGGFLLGHEGMLLHRARNEGAFQQGSLEVGQTFTLHSTRPFPQRTAFRFEPGRTGTYRSIG